MDNNIMNNIETQVGKIYLDYKNQIEYINDIDSANQLMSLEYRKINNYLEGVIEEVKLDLYEEILKLHGIELAEKFNRCNFKMIEMKEYSLKTSDIYEEVVVSNNINTKLKEDNHKKNSNDNVAMVSVLALVGGGVIGGTISNSMDKPILSGAMIGGIVGCGLGLGLLFLVSNSNSTNKSVNSNTKKNNSKAKKENKLRFSSKKMMNIINKREAEAKRTIKDNILQINSKYDEVCRGI